MGKYGKYDTATISDELKVYYIKGPPVPSYLGDPGPAVA